ncbi:MAG: ATP-binding cassette domain-containing protein, partial [Candidatus Bathyarchaeota archaeon]|nr:ATP-binding cassette domain-containing protein [Candidatus Bathyarchaeota archaeon]
GRCVASVTRNEVDEHELVRLMIGTDIDRHTVRDRVELGEEVLRVEDLHVLDDMGGEAVRGVNFYVRRGEIFGIAGVAGNGQRELVEAITGLRDVSRGRILIKGEELSSPRRFRLYGSHIPDERIGLGLLPSFTVLDNIALTFYKNFSNNGFIKFNELKLHTERLVETYDVVTPSLGTLAGKLSGGNIARLILARELSSDKDLIVAVHPTFGLDIASTNKVRKLLLELRRKSAVLLVSEDLEEILQLSDRIAVMYGGRFVDIVEADEADPEKIGLMMSGVMGS